MHRNKFTLLAILPILLLSCNQIEIKKKDISGSWIVNTEIYKNTKFVASSKTAKATMTLPGYEGKNTLVFNIEDSTAVFPGMGTEDVPCKWFVKDNRLIIAFDTLKFEKNALASIDNLKIESILRRDPALKKTYNFKRDSILKNRSINIYKLPLSIYAGTYSIAKADSLLILTSSTTRFELLNLDDMLKRRIDGMLDDR